MIRKSISAFVFLFALQGFACPDKPKTFTSLEDFKNTCWEALGDHENGVPSQRVDFHETSLYFGISAGRGVGGELTHIYWVDGNPEAEGLGKYPSIHDGIGRRRDRFSGRILYPDHFTFYVVSPECLMTSFYPNQCLHQRSCK